MARRAARVDANQAEIVKALRKIGASVQHLHTVGAGCPDILVGYRGQNVLMEIKRSGEKLTGREGLWHKYWRGQVAIVRTYEEAINALYERYAYSA